jgi:threonine synthase
LWIKNDAVNYPTLSFKDRVVSVALSRSRELGFSTVACASTGNLANSVAAIAAASGMKAYVFIPADLEHSKVMNSLIYGATVVGIKGHYDEVNRLCAEIAGKYGWAFVNVNMRPYYAEGSKSMGFEIVEQLGWKVPSHTVVCMASGSLLTKIHKSYQELIRLGLAPIPVTTSTAPKPPAVPRSPPPIRRASISSNPSSLRPSPNPWRSARPPTDSTP